MLATTAHRQPRSSPPAVPQLVPAVGTSVWYGLLKARAFAVPDPAFMFVCLAMLAVPTAVNMQTIANIFG